MGTESVPKTSENFHILQSVFAPEYLIEFCRRENERLTIENHTHLLHCFITRFKPEQAGSTNCIRVITEMALR